MATAAQISERKAAHVAKMKRKAARVLVPGFTPMDDKRHAPLRFRLQAEGKGFSFNISTDARRRMAHGSIAQANRHTGKPHEHRRERGQAA